MMLKNISMLASASAVAQFVTLLSLPVLSRLFNDEAFGIFQIYVSTLNFILMFSALRYEMAILAADTKFRYKNLVRLAFRLILLVCGISICFSIVVAPYIVNSYQYGEFILYFVPLMTLIGGIFYSVSHIVIREREYKLSAESKMLQAISYVLAAFLFARFGWVIIGLVVADLVSRLLSALWLTWRLPQISRMLSKSINWTHARLVAYRYRDYPTFALPGSSLSALLGIVVPFTFFAMYDLSVAGQYALVERFVLLPIGVVVAAAGQVFTGDFSEQVRTKGGNLNGTFRRVILSAFLVGLAPALLLFFAGPTVVPFVFGSQWSLAGEICSIAAPIALTRLVAGPVHMAIVACDRQGLQLTWEVGRFFFTVFLFLIIAYIDVKNPLHVMEVYAASVTVSYVLFLVLADYVTQQKDGISLKENQEKF